MLRNKTLSVILLLAMLLSPAWSPDITASAQVVASTADAGDAPDSTNSAGAAMFAYPGVTANFPTALNAAPLGPLHLNTTPAYWLGRSYSGENDPESSADEDGFSNISPATGEDDRDQQDNGLNLPAGFEACQVYQLPVQVTSARDLSAGTNAYLNLWVDWDRSGDWGQSLTSQCSTVISEWAVQNQVITITQVGEQQVFTTTAFVAANAMSDKDLWLRVSLSDAPAPNADGRGAAGGYNFGETEDFRLEGAPVLPDILPPPVLAAAEFDDIEETTHVLFLPVMKRSGLPVALPPGKPNETDVAFIGGSPFGGDKPVVVTAAGSGANFVLSSWRVNYQNTPPVFLHETPGVAGHHVQLLTLIPDTFAGQYHTLVSGSVGYDGNLWLTTWQVDKNGVFTQLSKRGYGQNAGVTVKDFAVTYRQIKDGSGQTLAYQLATPVLTSAGKLRLVSWLVNATTGVISGQQDSGDWGNPRSDSPLQAIYQEGDDWTGHHFVVGFFNAAGKAMVYSWFLNPQGKPFFLGTGDDGTGRTGVDIRGANPFVVSAAQSALSPLNKTGFMMASASVNGSLTSMNTMANQRLTCTDEGCTYIPYNISEAGLDTDNDYGVSIPNPVVGAFQGQLSDASILNGSVVYQWPAAGYTNQIIASVTKIMTVIVTLDEVDKGNVDLSDIVTVPAAAPSKCGSCMNLAAGEKISLRDLLYGLMINSGNDAGYAIAEYVGGSVANFTTLMNDMAADLGLSNTTYCDGWGGCASNPADQVKLWLAAYQDPDFQHFLGIESIFTCGEDSNGDPLCHNMTRNVTSLYPGLESWKGGSLGFACGTGVSYCTSGGCLTTQATRLERTLVLNLLNPQGQPTINRWNDAYNVFDYGYRKIFTPDYIGANAAANALPAKDIAIDAVLGGSMVVTSLIDASDQLKVCAWTPSIPTEEVELLGCATRGISLSPSAPQAAPTLVDMTLLPEFSFDGAYVTANLTAGKMNLRYYLVGEQP